MSEQSVFRRVGQRDRKAPAESNGLTCTRPPRVATDLSRNASPISRPDTLLRSPQIGASVLDFPGALMGPARCCSAQARHTAALPVLTHSHHSADTPDSVKPGVAVRRQSGQFLNLNSPGAAVATTTARLPPGGRAATESHGDNCHRNASHKSASELNHGLPRCLSPTDDRITRELTIASQKLSEFRDFPEIVIFAAISLVFRAVCVPARIVRSRNGRMRSKSRASRWRVFAAGSGHAAHTGRSYGIAGRGVWRRPLY